MTQLTLNIENKSLVPIIKKLISELNGVSIAPQVRRKKNGLERALDDIKHGRVSGPFNSMEEVMNHLNS